MNSPSTSFRASGGGRRGSFSETKYIYNKSRTGPYPQKTRQQRRSLTLNETFRALFPAIFAVILSLLVLSAFNHLQSNNVLEWINENAITIPGYSHFHKSSSSSQIMKIDGKVPPFNLEEYEKLGPLMSGSYIANKNRGLEYQKNRKLDLRSMVDPKSQSFGPQQASYWENLGKLKEMEEKKVSNQFN